jgi:N-hydroxyarylamine O-acetyltransferase
MNATAYLARIGLSRPPEPTASALCGLQTAHLLSVPFENLDIHLGRPIRLDLPALYDKIVARRRGGFCYELNGLFAWLLSELGYAVTYLSASDAHADGTYGPEFDHLALAVRCPADGDDRAWLADVGWGDSFTAPLPLDLTGEQPEGRRAYRLEREAAALTVVQRRYDGEWERQYRLTLAARQLADFAPMCEYHQTSPASHFTSERIVTRATPEGRVSLSGRRLIETAGGERTETVLGSEDEYRLVLRERFGLAL